MVKCELLDTTTENLLDEIQELNDGDTIEVYCYWSCDACGGDSDTGCLMSDPDDCVRG